MYVGIENKICTKSVKELVKDQFLSITDNHLMLIIAFACERFGSLKVNLILDNTRPSLRRHERSNLSFFQKKNLITRGKLFHLKVETSVELK